MCFWFNSQRYDSLSQCGIKWYQYSHLTLEKKVYFPKWTIPLHCSLILKWKGQNCFHASNFSFPLCPCRIQTQRRLNHSEQMLNPPLQGTNPVRQQRATASDPQVLTLIPTTSHPAGTGSSTQITVQWVRRDAASIHKQQTRLLFDILTLEICFSSWL